MEYVICYDLTDDRRRDRLAKTLLDYGKRIQHSVFVAHLDDELLERMMARVRGVIEDREDRVHVFAMCGTCEGKVIALGTAEVPKDAEFYII